jgi:hypothetical protein
MNIQSRKIQFIQEFLKYTDESALAKFEELLMQEKAKALEKEIYPMTLNDYEQRIAKSFNDVKNNKVKNARSMKNEIATWM